MALELVREVQGVRVPALFYGTAWKQERTQSLTTAALSRGFRAIDSANQRKHYFEAEVGSAVQAWMAQPGHDRRDLFIQSKFTHRGGQDERLPYDPRARVSVQVEQSLQSTLDHFGCEAVDSLLLHGPSTRVGLAAEDWEAWRAMESLCERGKVRLIGISNVSLQQLGELWQRAAIKPAFVQNRCYATTGWDYTVRRFATDHGMGYQGFSLLTANAREVRSKPVVEIAARHGVSPEVIVLRYALEIGIFVLTGTSDPQHQKDDLAGAQIPLSDSDCATLERLLATASSRSG